MRPRPPDEGSDRYEWVVVQDDAWEALPEPDLEHRCRWGSDRYGTRCREASVAVLRRRSRKRSGVVWTRWFYCAAHMYGRWIENGRVMRWKARRRA